MKLFDHCSDLLRRSIDLPKSSVVIKVNWCVVKPLGHFLNVTCHSSGDLSSLPCLSLGNQI